MKAVALPEPDYSRCRAAVLSGTVGSLQQCRRAPRANRQAEDGRIYAVCNQHKRARWFLPWSHRLLPGALDASRAYQRLIERAYQRLIEKLLSE